MNLLVTGVWAEVVPFDGGDDSTVEHPGPGIRKEQASYGCLSEADRDITQDTDGLLRRKRCDDSLRSLSR
jgi:hypothetical protein